MKKNNPQYSDLSKKEIQYIKEFYIQRKVDGMNHKELKEFVSDIISHQILETIGKEEEMEAWEEIADYFGDQLEIIISEIKQKYKDRDSPIDYEEDHQKERLDFLEKSNLDKGKKDMWDD